jgi:hypothetical protein
MKPDNPESYDVVAPNPSAMIESLRAFGYNLETAIADIIDNSIAAEAENVWLNFKWNGERSTISIIDDGGGMDEKELINAMRPGSTSPLEERNSTDLGRFGLGLKTASFSQCRKLTVGSKKEGGLISIRSWDLDYVNECGEWRLLNVDKIYADGVFSTLEEMKSGTIVLWEEMDRLVKGINRENQKYENMFYENIDFVKNHLAMVFHRFLENKSNFKIFINNRPLNPWDPFLRNHPSTQHLPREPLHNSGHKVLIQPYILPHRSKMDDNTYELASGPGGWNARQGFYIYRNNRIIVAGDWLGTGFKKEDYTKLARISVDIPNSLDDAWKIDIKKSTARPPTQLREDFKRLARLTAERATLVYRHRGKTILRKTADEFVFPWETKIHNGKYAYNVNRKHPIVFDVLENAGEQKGKIQAMLRLIEETVPVPLIILNNSEKADNIYNPFEKAPSEDLKFVMEEVWDSMERSGISFKDAKNRLLNMEPFCDYPGYVASFLEGRGED